MWELLLLDDLAIECGIIVHRANCRRSPFALPGGVFLTLEVSEGSSAKLLVPVLHPNVKAITPRRILPFNCHLGFYWRMYIWSILIILKITKGQFSKFPKALCFTNVCSLVGKRCSMKGRVGSLWCSGADPWLRGWILGVSRSTTSSQDRRRGDFQSAQSSWLVRIWYEYIVCTVIQTWNIEIYFYFIWYSIDTQWYTH